MLEFFTNLKVGTKILVICLFLAIIPTLLLGVVAYTSSSSVINEQTQSLLETQVNDMKGWTNDVYKLTRNKVNSDLNVAKQNFYGERPARGHQREDDPCGQHRQAVHCQRQLRDR